MHSLMAGRRASRLRVARKGLVAGALLMTCWIGRSAAQSRPPLSQAADPTGVLSAIRAVDIRQLCRCPVVALDSTVRNAKRPRMFEVLGDPPAFVLSGADVGRLRLAGYRVVRTKLRAMTDAARDTALMAVARLPATGAGSPILIVIAPPNGVTAAYVVTVRRERAAWLVTGRRTVFDP
jgi:hypothetical protein